METIPGTVLKKVGDFTTPDFVKRHPGNPLLSCDQVPYRSTNTHNCGVIRYKAGYVMLFRCDARESRENPNHMRWSVGIADSPDGIAWTVRPEPTPLPGGDPRITRIGDTFYVCMAFECGASTWKTKDFVSYEENDHTLPGTRNQSLFPERINGKYYRLERPMWQPNMPYVNSGNAPGGWIGDTWDIWISESPDLVYWGKPSLLLRTNDLDYANAKIGGGPPPLRTDEGWLCLIHGDDIDPRRGKNGWEPTWFGRYHAGLMLLDLEDPRKVIAYSKKPFLTPESDLECRDGYRNNVVFVTSYILKDDGELLMYYGAADTYVCAATASLAELIQFCKNE
jgi:beta-1,4-mannooligosaccharide/beta-1,4-mannosyl-N-acetylglucosamine phosphorylase